MKLIMKMKTTKLAILTAAVLFTFGLTFSSCENCRYRDLRIYNNPALAGIRGYLQDKGASEEEIIATMAIATEDFGDNIGHIVLKDGHYSYKDEKGYHSGRQTHNNCGVYAMKRMLFILGKHGKVDKNLWYQHTDDELRCCVQVKLFGQNVEHNKHNKVLAPGYVVRTMMELGVDGDIAQYACVFDKNHSMVPIYLPMPLPTPEEIAPLRARTDDLIKRWQAVIEKSRAAQALAEANRTNKIVLADALKNAEDAYEEAKNIDSECSKLDTDILNLQKQKMSVDLINISEDLRKAHIDTIYYPSLPLTEVRSIARAAGMMPPWVE